MNPGEFRQRISILGNIEVENKHGEIEIKEQEVYSIWAKVIPIRGREYQESKKNRPELAYRITTRYREDIFPDMKIKFKEKTLLIEAVINIASRGSFLEINCKEIVKNSNKII